MSLEILVNDLTNFIDNNLTGEVYFNDYEDRLDTIDTFINVDISIDGEDSQKTLLQAHNKAIFEQDIKVTFFIYNHKKQSLINTIKLIQQVQNLLKKRSLYPAGLRLTNTISTKNAIVDGRLGDKFNNYIIEAFFKYDYVDFIA